MIRLEPLSRITIGLPIVGCPNLSLDRCPNLGFSGGFGYSVVESARDRGEIHIITSNNLDNFGQYGHIRLGKQGSGAYGVGKGNWTLMTYNVSLVALLHRIWLNSLITPS